MTKETLSFFEGFLSTFDWEGSSCFKSALSARISGVRVTASMSLATPLGT